MRYIHCIKWVDVDLLIVRFLLPQVQHFDVVHAFHYRRLDIAVVLQLESSMSTQNRRKIIMRAIDLVK